MEEWNYNHRSHNIVHSCYNNNVNNLNNDNCSNNNNEWHEINVSHKDYQCFCEGLSLVNIHISLAITKKATVTETVIITKIIVLIQYSHIRCLPKQGKHLIMLDLEWKLTR